LTPTPPLQHYSSSLYLFLFPLWDAGTLALVPRGDDAIMFSV
jgi:hypothetical protein